MSSTTMSREAARTVASSTSQDAWFGVRVSLCLFFFSSRRRHTRLVSDWSSDVCSSDLERQLTFRPEGLLLDQPDGLADPEGDAGGHEAHPYLRPLGVETDREMRVDEIGRASCRERV